MGYILTNVGEEWYAKTNLDNATPDVLLYNDNTDSISDTDNLGAITTEPSGGSYARQSAAVTTSKISGDWGFDNDSQLSFDTSDSSQSVDGYGIVPNFQSAEAGDGSAQDNLAATGALSQTRNLSDIDTLNISAGGIGVTVN